jgi:hypothetical protein
MPDSLRCVGLIMCSDLWFMEAKMNAKQKIADLDRAAVEQERSAGPGIFAGLPPEVPDTISATDRRVYRKQP